MLTKKPGFTEKWIFLISDIISYKGEHLTKFQLPERIAMLNNILDNEYTEDYPMDICKYSYYGIISPDSIQFKVYRQDRSHRRWRI